MLLPATGVEIPSDDWKLVKFHEYKEESTDTRMSFEADILHIPTGLMLVVENTGRSDEHSWGVCHPKREKDVDRETTQEVLTAWDALTLDCLPVLREREAEYNIFPGSESMWAGENHRAEYLRDGVFEFFLSEHEVQNDYSRKRKVIVRHDDDNKVYTYGTTNPLDLAGRVKGSYWDKKAKNWVKL
jgi:hypothetical protein